jgi:hypothetical protein
MHAIHRIIAAPLCAPKPDGRGRISFNILLSVFHHLFDDFNHPRSEHAFHRRGGQYRQAQPELAAHPLMSTNLRSMFALPPVADSES